VDEALLGGAEGCYLYFDTVNNQWIRSGKVAGTSEDPRGIIDRDGNHASNAARNCSGSQLYREYPARESELVQRAKANNVHPLPWRAYFHELSLFSGISFIRSDTVVQNLVTDVNAERDDDDVTCGVFSWDSQTIGSLNRHEREGVTSLEDKKIHMVSYLLELGFDLMLSTEWNVSTQPGFEKYGLVNYASV
jgi:hypothetical protein